MFEPTFLALLALAVMIGAIWVFSSIVNFLTFPLRLVVGVKKPIMRRFIVRLISYMGQDFITNLQRYVAHRLCVDYCGSESTSRLCSFFFFLHKNEVLVVLLKSWTKNVQRVVFLCLQVA